MQINNRYNGSPVSRTRRSDGVHTSVDQSRAQDAQSPVQSSIAGYRHELQELPESRFDLVAQVRERFLAGEYLTDEMAKATAGALLNAG